MRIGKSRTVGANSTRNGSKIDRSDRIDNEPSTKMQHSRVSVTVDEIEMGMACTVVDKRVEDASE